MDGDETVEVEVEVTTDEGAPAPGDTTVVAVAPAPPAGGVDGDVLAILVEHGERLTALEATVGRLAGEAAEAAVTAGYALDEVERVAVQTEEAVATLAEQAEEATAEVVAEVEDIAPGREHPWYARRSVLGRGDS